MLTESFFTGAKPSAPAAGASGAALAAAGSGDASMAGMDMSGGVDDMSV